MLQPESVHHTVRINVPHWFARPDFMAWLNNPDNAVATWHNKGTEATPMSDVFMTYDHGEGSDLGSDDFPEDIEKELIEMMQRTNFDYAVLWLTNLV